jgi:hypothetical protein
MVLLKISLIDFRLLEKIMQYFSPRRMPASATTTEAGNGSGFQGRLRRGCTFGLTGKPNFELRELSRGNTLTFDPAADRFATTQTADGTQHTQEHDEAEFDDDEQPISDAQRELNRAEALATLMYEETRRKETALPSSA